MNAVERVALANDREAADALQVLLKGLTVGRPQLAPILGDEKVLEALIDESSGALGEVRKMDDAKAVRAILVQLAEDEGTAPSLVAALGERKKLIEPVTTALVLAGIVMLLSTEVEISIKDVNGKRSTSVHIKKGKTSDGILKRFFGLFGG